MKGRGFTLAEALVSLTLSITILAMIGALMSRLADSSRSAAQREALNQASQAVMNRLANDCRSAIEWVAPLTGTQDRLDLFLPDYSKPRFVVTPPATVWNPQKTENRVRVSYRLDGGRLVRTLTPHALQSETTILAESVQVFSVHRQYQQVQLRLSLKDSSGIVRTLENDVLLPLQQCWGAP